jgi:beta-1,4-mannosyl-glycoprotein beta-1,4-N-acetylglucosaminyltransferase
MFFNELDMLETRMHILGDVVDHFVVCEAAETHSGIPKPYHFMANRERFERWADKIIYVQVDDLTHRSGNADRTSWERERFHRFCISDGLKRAAYDDYIICGDCDEIANPEAVTQVARTVSQYDGAILEMAMYYYDLNHRVELGWGIGMMHHRLYYDPNNIRTGAGAAFPHIDNGGWHFSYFGGAQAIVEKVDAFMHHADVAAHLPRNSAYIADKVAAGKDLYNRAEPKIVPVPLSDALPRYILDNLDKYRVLGWVRE